ncbi:MAG: serine hydrolase [Cyclobacteriaceae bacterium]|nr:serine hydrolase [Cyclobacteriaceae bacterium]
MKTTLRIHLILTLLALCFIAQAQELPVEARLKGIDETINAVLKKWNVPGAGVGVVVKDKLVWSKGFGYRDVENKLPVTAQTQFQIASNTKLFTSTGIGLLVEKGLLNWDKPIRDYCPQVQFYNDDLNKNVTIRDMLSHRTGLSRHDFIWLGADFTRQEIFERIKYLEPSLPLRQGYLYNNLMYITAGRVIELLTQQTWEDYTRENFFAPLKMTQSTFFTEDMQKSGNYMKSYYEKLEGATLAPYPMYTKNTALGPAGSIISSINDMSHWLIAHMNGGEYENSSVIPSSIIRETMTPATIDSYVPGTNYESLNSIYGMGRRTMSYKGHYRTEHGGAIGGIYSLVSFMPADSLGVIVFTNGEHASVLPVVIGNIFYDKLLELEQTPWSDRTYDGYAKRRETSRQNRKKSDADRIANTKPSHPIAQYAGAYESPAYGVVEIKESKGQLSFSYHTVDLPLSHYHYDRFVSDNDEVWGRWNFEFATDAQGRIQTVTINLDEQDVVFTRTFDKQLTNPEFLRRLIGTYTSSSGQVTINLEKTRLFIQSSLPQYFAPYKNMQFRSESHSDQTIEFVLDDKGNRSKLVRIEDGKATEYTRK